MSANAYSDLQAIASNTRPGAQLSASVQNHDLVTTGDFTLPETAVGDASELAIGATAAATATVTVQWTDGAGAVLFSESPASVTNVTAVNETFAVKSDHVRVVVTNTDGTATTNALTGTFHGH